MEKGALDVGADAHAALKHLAGQAEGKQQLSTLNCRGRVLQQVVQGVPVCLPAPPQQPPPTFCSISSAQGVSVASLRSTPVGKMPKNCTGRLMGHDHWLQ